MPLPSDFFDEDVNYRIRLCMLVDEATAVAFGSKINPCDGCDALIWVNENQEIPPLPEGMTLNGDVNLCRNCAADVFRRAAVEEPVFLEDPPHADIDEVKKYFGMTPP
jgi:hypothetical protein